MSADFNVDRMHTRLKGFFSALEWNDALAALEFAREKHGGQLRKGGQPYIVHPYTMACHALALGIRIEAVAAAALLHDVCEDCGVEPGDLPVGREIQDAVRLLTHGKSQPMEDYYAGIARSPVAAIVKLLDRCDNVSTMAGVFAPTKIKDYVEETRTYVLPLIPIVKHAVPAFSDALFVLKYHVVSIIDAQERCLMAADA